MSTTRTLYTTRMIFSGYLNSGDEKIESLLSLRYAYILAERKWQTPYGVSFVHTAEMAWYITYDKENTNKRGTLENKHIRAIRREEIPRLVKQFDRRSEKKGLDGIFSVYKKPRAIRNLEALFAGSKITAHLHKTAPLVWRFGVPNLFTALCNPFNVMPDRIFSSSKLNFDLRMKKKDMLSVYIRKYISLDDLLEVLRSNDMIPISKICNGCDVITTFKCLHKCARCQKAYYCGKQCQKQDWHTHRKDCK